MEVHIRDASNYDAEVVMTLLKQLWPGRDLNEEKMIGTFLDSMKRPEYYNFCAEISGKVAAFCAGMSLYSLYNHGKICYLTTLIVDSEYRGCRIGSKMIERLKQYSLENDCVAIELDTALYRVDAHRFYEREGFVKRAFVYSQDIKRK
jgi:Acetyltransferases